MQEASRGDQELRDMAAPSNTGEAFTQCHMIIFIIPYLEIGCQIIHLKRFQFFNGRWVKSQRSVTFPTHDLEPLRYTVENGNGNNRNQNGPMQVEDTDKKQSSLKRQLTPPTDTDNQPPAKRSLQDGDVEGEITMIEEASDAGEEEPVDGEPGDNCAARREGEPDDRDEAGGDGEGGEAGDDGEASKAEQPASVQTSQTDELLPSNMPKIYDLFATCVSLNVTYLLFSYCRVHVCFYIFHAVSQWSDGRRTLRLFCQKC